MKVRQILMEILMARTKQKLGVREQSNSQILLNVLKNDKNRKRNMFRNSNSNKRDGVA